MGLYIYRICNDTRWSIKMRKIPKSILIYGSYGRGNYGDEIILDALLQNLKPDYNVNVLVPGDLDEVSKLHDVGVIPWSISFHNKTFLGKSTTLFKSILILNHNIKNHDIILIGGGNMLMDLFPRIPFKIFLLCCLSKINRKKICFIGCGAGPIYQRISEVLFKISLRMADLITIRDNMSYRLIKQLCPSNKKVFECSDLIFSHPYFNEKFNPINQKIESIAINILYNKPGYYPTANEQKENYRQLIAEIINYFIKCNNIKKILLFTTSHPDDDDALKEIRNHINSQQNKEINFYYKSVSFIELSRILENYDLVVTSRLHSLFLSICLNKLVIPLIYQEKVENWINENNMDSISIDIRKLSSESLLRFKSILEEIEDNPQDYLNRINEIKTKCVINSKKNLTVLRNFIEEA